LARAADDTTRERLEALAAELEQKLREIDEQADDGEGLFEFPPLADRQ
jgi:hypothetical protein